MCVYACVPKNTHFLYVVQPEVSGTLEHREQNLDWYVQIQSMSKGTFKTLLVLQKGETSFTFF